MTDGTSSQSLAGRSKNRFAEAVTRAWYQPGLNPLLFPLLPLAKLVAAEAGRRYRHFRRTPPDSLPVPVIVVGNITAGGTGKTPLVAAMVRCLRENGYRPGIVSRGYGSASANGSRLVSRLDDPSVFGDEPVMLADITGVPVVVDAHRRRGAEFLLSQSDCNLIISDDGLQHYRLPRDIEIAVIDGARGLGNGYCLPAGPLRESPGRLADVDAVICNGSLTGELPAGYETMALEPVALVPLAGGEALSPDQFRGQDVCAVAGIGNPERFFQTLRGCGVKVTGYPFPDHHGFTARDLSSLSGQTVIMTAKDAIKCRRFAGDNWWYLAVEARLPESFWKMLLDKLAAL